MCGILDCRAGYIYEKIEQDVRLDDREKRKRVATSLHMWSPQAHIPSRCGVHAPVGPRAVDVETLSWSR